MGRGKIRGLDFTRYSLLFPGDHSHASDADCRYAVCTDPAGLDFGTGDFAIEIACWWDSVSDATAGQYRVLVQKCPDYVAADTTNLNSAAGWCICFNPENQRISLKFNDGNATALNHDWDGIFPSDSPAFFRLEFDRDVGVLLYKNGVYDSTYTGITGRPNSVSNSNNLIIGGQPGATLSFLKGAIKLLRFDTGYNNVLDSTGYMWNYSYPVTYGEVWNNEAYLKLKHLWPETLQHYRAAWYFENSLVDLSSDGYTFIFKDGGGTTKTATYTANWPYILDYSFAFDPLSSGSTWGFLDLNAKIRSLDGTLRVYQGPAKLHKTLNFRIDDVEQLIALVGAYYTHAPIHIYDEDYQPFNFRGFMTTAPTVTELWKIGNQLDLSAYRRAWEIQIELEEM